MRVLLALLLAGCAHDPETEPTAPPKELVQLAVAPPAPAPAPAPAPVPHTQVIRVESWGLGGSSKIEVDLDAGTFHVVEDLMDKKVDDAHELTPGQSTKLTELAKQVWIDPVPNENNARHITDSREDLTLIDGDKRWYHSDAEMTASAGTLYTAVWRLVVPEHSIHVTAQTVGGPEDIHIDLDSHMLSAVIAGRDRSRELEDGEVAKLRRLEAPVWKEPQTGAPEGEVRCGDCEVKLVLIDGTHEWHRTDAPTAAGTARAKLAEAIWKLLQ